MKARQRIVAISVLTGIILILTVWAWTVHSQERVQSPRLLPDRSVAADLGVLADEAWTAFLTVFATRVDCFGDVSLRAVTELDGRAVYDPVTATVTVRVPATAAILREALVHEWAHHVEFQCDAHRDLRPRFLAALDLPPETPWFDGATWDEIPSELYAEAVVELVLGRRQIPTKARLTPQAVTAVAAWAADE